MYINLPKEIGARTEVPRGDDAFRRELEGRGFFIEKATPQRYVIRRDYAVKFQRIITIARPGRFVCTQICSIHQRFAISTFEQHIVSESVKNRTIENSSR